MVVAATYRVNLHCPDCAQKIRTPLIRTPGVHDVDVYFEKSEVKVVGVIEAKFIHERIAKLSKKKVETVKVEADFKETTVVEKIIKETKQPELHTTTIKTHMHCDQCERDLRRKLLKHKGIYDVKTNIKAQSLTIEGTVNPNELLSYIREKIHKHAEIVSNNQAKKDEKKEAEAKGAEKMKDAETSKESKNENVEIVKMTDSTELKELDEKLRSSNVPYVIQYVYAPPWFSDEDPNSCSIT
ncbi:hypothetical protein Drorol1_Dr00000194 [Drosera rotundifolia]